MTSDNIGEGRRDVLDAAFEAKGRQVQPHRIEPGEQIVVGRFSDLAASQQLVGKQEKARRFDGGRLDYQRLGCGRIAANMLRKVKTGLAKDAASAGAGVQRREFAIL